MKSKIAEQTRLLVDDEAWNRAGDELRLVDPKRYLAVLQIVEDICNIHRDPIGAKVTEGFYAFAQAKAGEFD